MKMPTISQKFLVADVVIIGLYGSLRSFSLTFVCKAPVNYLAANFVGLVLLSLSVAISIMGARAPEYRMRWMFFAVASLLGFLLIGGVNAVDALISLMRVLIW